MTTDTRTFRLGAATVSVLNLGTLQGDLAEWLRVPESDWPPHYAGDFRRPIPVPVQCIHIALPGMSVLVPIYAIHRHARRWAEPDAFDPGRFAPALEEAIPRYQYMPFGAGPRICIGMSFAMIEATAILATLVRAARFAPVDGHEPRPLASVTLVPRGGMPLEVTAA